MLDAAEFPKNSNSLDGLATRCRLCTLSALRERRAAWKRLVTSGLAHRALPPEKQCTMCGLVKERGEFNLNARDLDGLYHMCAACTNETKRQRYSVRRARRQEPPASSL